MAGGVNNAEDRLTALVDDLLDDEKHGDQSRGFMVCGTHDADGNAVIVEPNTIIVDCGNGEWMVTHRPRNRAERRSLSRSIRRNEFWSRDARKR